MNHYKKIKHKYPEQWKDIKSFEGLYEVSNKGRVRALAKRNSLGNHLKEKLLKQTVNHKGYCRVVLYRDNKRHRFVVHRLVVSAFTGFVFPKGMRKYQVNHINGVKNDNQISNLEVVTPRENIQHAIETGLTEAYFKGSKNRYARPVVCFLNGVKFKEFGSMVEASKDLGILQQNISATVRGLRKSAGGFTWKYVK
jgi:hypothetical protein